MTDRTDSAVGRRDHGLAAVRRITTRVTALAAVGVGVLAGFFARTAPGHHTGSRQGVAPAHPTAAASPQPTQATQTTQPAPQTPPDSGGYAPAPQDTLQPPPAPPAPAPGPGDVTSGGS